MAKKQRSPETIFLSSLPLIRRSIQLGFGLFTLYVGYRFYAFYCWTIGRGDYVPRPPAVEGFLPISALMSLKRFLLSGEYDLIHPAGLTIFLAALCISLLLRKGFCGWICPIGLASHLAEAGGRKMKTLWNLPRPLNFTLMGIKYLLLGFFLYVIVWRMELSAIEYFLQTPYNVSADAKMLLFFLQPGGAALGILLFLLFVSFVIKNFWCRFLCPYGALLGILALLSPLQVRRQEANCISCNKCDKICPADLKISQKTTVRSPECIGCLECLAVCPQKNCLKITHPLGKLKAYFLPVAVVGLFLLIWLAALSSGHWYTQISPELFKKTYIMAPKLDHPRY